jgi:OOP family OmpA-OmpF porin
MKKSFLGLLCAILTTGAFAQESNNTPKYSEEYNLWSVGIHAGNVLTLGDYRGMRGDNAGFDLGYGLDVNYRFNHVFGLQGRFMLGGATGGNAYQIPSLLGDSYFENSFISGDVSALLYLPNLASQRKENRWFLPYASAGLGFVNYDAQNYLASDDSQLADTSGTSLMMPFGIGGLIRLGDKWNIDVNMTANVDFNNQFDGYVGNGGSDAHLYTSIGVNYVFGKKEKSVEWVNPMDQMYMDMQSMQNTVDEISKDTDGDGVPDKFDEDNNTPNGVAVDGRGRALDVDGDGVPDYMDVDPFSPKGAEVDASGREKDSDGDGVPDSRDREPNSAKGALVNFQGVTIPTAGGAVINSFIPSVYFSLESSTVTYANYERLAVVGKMLKANPDLKLRIIGHTDPTGSESYNQKLSERRAQSVVDHLVKYYGIDESRLVVSARGENEQLNDGYNKVNRRVDFEIIQ